VPPFFIFTNFLYNRMRRSNDYRRLNCLRKNNNYRGLNRNIEKKMVDLWAYLKREEKHLPLLNLLL
jgi:hypothetical protein